MCTNRRLLTAQPIGLCCCFNALPISWQGDEEVYRAMQMERPHRHQFYPANSD